MQYLPESWDAANLGRATKGAAKALLGKAYMQQHKYDLAKAELQWLIDKEGSLYGLIENREDNFTDLDENNKEGIFEIQFDDQNKGGTGNDASMAFGFQRTQFYGPSGIGWGDGKARRWLVDEFLKEKRVDGKNDLRLYNSILYRGFSQDFLTNRRNIIGLRTPTGTMVGERIPRIATSVNTTHPTFVMLKITLHVTTTASCVMLTS